MRESVLVLIGVCGAVGLCTVMGTLPGCSREADETSELNRWAEDLASGDWDARDAARTALRRAGPRSVPSLIPLLKHDSADVRSEAVYVLGRIGPPGYEAVPALMDVLDDPDVRLRAEAAGALWEIDPDTSEESIPVLIEALEDPKWWRTAALALAAMGARAEPAVPTLANLLDHPDTLARDTAMLVLRSIGPAARAAVPKVRPFLQDADPSTRLWAYDALWRIAPETRQECLSAFVSHLAHDDRRVRGTALMRIMDLKPRRLTSDAEAALVKAMDEWPEFRFEVAVMLVEAGGKRTDAIVPALLAVARDEMARERSEAWETLVAVGPPAVPYLTDALKDPRLVVSTDLVRTLGRIRPVTSGAVAALIRVLKEDPFSHTRAVTARVIGENFGGRPEAVEALRQATRDPDENVALRAQLALEELGHGNPRED